MRPFVKLLWPFVIYEAEFRDWSVCDIGLASGHTAIVKYATVVRPQYRLLSVHGRLVLCCSLMVIHHILRPNRQPTVQAGERRFPGRTVKRTSDPPRSPSPRSNWNCDWNTTRIWYQRTLHDAISCPTRHQIFTETPQAFTCISMFYKKKLSYRRGTARRTMSVEILSTAVQLYEKSQLSLVFHVLFYIVLLIVL